MSGSRNKGTGLILWDSARPAIVGLLLSCVVTAGLIAAFSLLFVLLESIAQSAVVPLALLSAAAGCFAGAFICGSMIKHYGVIFGVVIGVMMFMIIIIIGLIGKEGIFGSETVIKLLVLLISGGSGGYFGSICKRNRRK